MEVAKEVKPTFKYSELKSYDFSNLIAKLANTPTQNGRANHIRHILKGYNKAADQIATEFKAEIIDIYALKKEDGTLLIPEGGDPNGFEPDPAKMEEFKKACEVFGDKTTTIDYRALTPDTLGDIKLSAKELNLLGDLFTEETGPGLPNLSPIR